MTHQNLKKVLITCICVAVLFLMLSQNIGPCVTAEDRTPTQKKLYFHYPSAKEYGFMDEDRTNGTNEWSYSGTYAPGPGSTKAYRNGFSFWFHEDPTKDSWSIGKVLEFDTSQKIHIKLKVILDLSITATVDKVDGKMMCYRGPDLESELITSDLEELTYNPSGDYEFDLDMDVTYLNETAIFVISMGFTITFVGALQYRFTAHLDGESYMTASMYETVVTNGGNGDEPNGSGIGSKKIVAPVVLLIVIVIAILVYMKIKGRKK